ncbi:DUF3622 domain-containing protein [Hahella ganghwensis]|uniref:DUF3622 domain-containing protein n=1 Tax=Hahella ganghwensis TaxID=286420 RepID=UPI0003734A81|nr:DUF3622 domain-containing protein [Hahella ganghwensis]
MTKSKKYDYRIVHDEMSWTGEIVRKVSNSKSVVSKRREGFATEADAKKWCEEEIKVFMQKQAEHNQRHASRRS